MKHWDTLRAMLRNGRLLIGLILTLSLVGCSLGEAAMPSPPTGVPADRSVGVVAPVPAPIPHSLEGRDQCFGCHAIGAVDAPPVPANHEQDVTLCTTCHAVWSVPAVAAAAAPAIPHGVEGREDCLVCHKLGTADAPRAPDNHDGLTSASCQTCHREMAEIAGSTEEEMQVAEIPLIPHGLAGFSACTQCHEEGGGGIPRFPDDHIGRTDDLCTACHRPAEEGEAAMPTAGPTEIPAEAPSATPTTEPTDIPAEAPSATPTTEPTELPAEAPSAMPTTQPTEIPTEAPSAPAGDVANGQVLFAASCAGCHGPDGEGTAIAPEALNDAELLAEHTDGDLTTVIREGVPNKMPPFPNLSDQELLDLLALLHSWE